MSFSSSRPFCPSGEFKSQESPLRGSREARAALYQVPSKSGAGVLPAPGSEPGSVPPDPRWRVRNRTSLWARATVRRLSSSLAPIGSPLYFSYYPVQCRAISNYQNKPFKWICWLTSDKSIFIFKWKCQSQIWNVCCPQSSAINVNFENLIYSYKWDIQCSI